jgi:hypothetical protein
MVKPGKRVRLAVIPGKVELQPVKRIPQVIVIIAGWWMMVARGSSTCRARVTASAVRGQGTASGRHRAFYAIE